MDSSDARSRPFAPGARRVVGSAGLLLLPLVVPACGGGDGAGAADGAGADEPEAAETEATETEAAGAADQEGPDLTEVNQYLRYSAADSLVEMELYAGLGGANSAWNFNGYHHGNATYVVPLGWRVEVTYETLDANVPHSAAVVEPADEIPSDPSGLSRAFSGASTPSFVSGIPSSRDAVTFGFRADEPGRYWIFCGVPGHAAGGMWIWLEVAEDADAPELREEGVDGEG